MAMNVFEKFSADELKSLRDELMHSGLDSFQSGDLLSTFLAQHGYGVSHAEARNAAHRIEAVGCTLPCLQEELESIAFVM